MRRYAAAVKVVCVWIILSLLAIEGGLRLWDGWGVLRAVRDLSTLWRNLEADPRGYRIRPGEYALSNWQATIQPDGTRRVPDTVPGKRRLILVGDSVTFGLGVSDSETWANLLARELPEWTVINAGVPAYNVENAVKTVNSIPGDLYLFMLVGNDAEPAFDWQHPDLADRYSAIILYWYWAGHIVKPATAKAAAAPVTTAWYNAALASLAGRSNVLIVGYVGDPLAEEAKRLYGAKITLIPAWRDRISVGDSHPNAAGHRDIAAGVIVAARVRR